MPLIIIIIIYHYYYYYYYHNNNNNNYSYSFIYLIYCDDDWWVYSMIQVTGTSPSSVFNLKSFQTVSEASTTLFLQPCLESHSSTTLATVLLPFLALILIILPHRTPWLYHPEDSATTLCGSGWNLPSHSEAPPPSPPRAKLLRVRMACVPEGSYAGEWWWWWWWSLDLRFAFARDGRCVIVRPNKSMNTPILFILNLSKVVATKEVVWSYIYIIGNVI